MSARIIKTGLSDTIQDAGRFGWQHLGVNTGGCMDLPSAALANMLVGNKKTEPVIEIFFPGCSYLFEEDTLIALSGADFNPLISGRPVPLNSSVAILKDSVLTFSRPVRGNCCYLAVHG